jgi:U1 small nuclear ribonucleoprotein
LQGDPFRTLFISRLSYDVTEKKLRKEFEEYGPIKTLRIVTDKTGMGGGVCVWGGGSQHGSSWAA